METESLISKFCQDYFMQPLGDDESCTRNAKIIVTKSNELGLKAYIFEVPDAPNQSELDNPSHSYVILKEQSSDDIALNNMNGGIKRTVEEVMKLGTDITETIMSLNWENI